MSPQLEARKKLGPGSGSHICKERTSWLELQCPLHPRPQPTAVVKWKNRLAKHPKATGVQKFRSDGTESAAHWPSQEAAFPFTSISPAIPRLPGTLLPPSGTQVYLDLNSSPAIC